MADYSLNEYIVLFFVYAFIGYIWEVVCVLIFQHKLVNRGFLYGPIIPIYGFGAILILKSTLSVANDYFLIFIYGMIFATALEMITGYLMYKIFKIKYWDYSNALFNFHGYICLKASLLWGLFSILLVKVVHPFIYNGIHTLFSLNDIIIYILIFVLSADITLSIKSAYDFRDILEKLRADTNNNGIPDVLEAIPEHMKENIMQARKKVLKFVERHPSAVFDKGLLEVTKKLRKILPNRGK